MKGGAEAKLGFPWSAVLVVPLVLAMAIAVLAHALKDLWWPWCHLDQILIDSRMASHFAALEESKGANEAIEFTLFHSVPASANGTVTTGNKWGSSKDRSPVRQYCYFAVRIEGVQRVRTLEVILLPVILFVAIYAATSWYLAPAVAERKHSATAIAACEAGVRAEEANARRLRASSESASAALDEILRIFGPLPAGRP